MTPVFIARSYFYFTVLSEPSQDSSTFKRISNSNIHVNYFILFLLPHAVRVNMKAADIRIDRHVAVSAAR